jgi:hypothetical protein
MPAPSASGLFGALGVAHGQMHRLRQRVGLIGRDTKRGTRLDHRRHELVLLVGAPVNRSVAQALDSDPGKSDGRAGLQFSAQLLCSLHAL